MLLIGMQQLLRVLGQKVKNEKGGWTVKEERKKKEEDNKNKKDAKPAQKKMMGTERQNRKMRDALACQMGILPRLHCGVITCALPS